MTTPLPVILNPAAGIQRDVVGRLRAALERGMLPFALHVTTGPGEAARLAREALSAGASRVAVCGGDGTVAEVAGVLAGSGVPLGVLPGGSGNFLARALGLPLRLEAAAALLLTPRPALRRLDLGLLNDQPFLVRAGIGFEAEVIARTPPLAKRGLGVFGYALGGLRALPRLRRVCFRVAIGGVAGDGGAEGQGAAERRPYTGAGDGGAEGQGAAERRPYTGGAPTAAESPTGVWEVRGVHLFLANTPGIGRLGLVLPGSPAPDDGLLDALVFDLLPGALSGFVAGALGWQAAPRAVWHIRGRALTIQADPPQRAHADGEPVPGPTYHLVVWPAAVTVIVPG